MDIEKITASLKNASSELALQTASQKNEAVLSVSDSIEKNRKIILEAFAEVKKEPEIYGKSFKTMIPKKEWSSNIGYKVEGQNANWIEQGLEWAQRIANGESWEAICNNADTADWYRLVVGKHGCLKFIGGSRKKEDCSPASSIHSYIPDAGNGYFCYAVPLVVKY